MADIVHCCVTLDWTNRNWPGQVNDARVIRASQADGASLDSRDLVGIAVVPVRRVGSGGTKESSTLEAVSQHYFGWSLGGKAVLRCVGWRTLGMVEGVGTNLATWSH